MDDREAAGGSGETARRRDTRPSKAASKAPVKEARRPGEKSARLQLHLPASLVQRLGVHCGMKRCSWSTEAARILEQYLVTHGQGRQLFEGDLSTLESPTQE